MGRTEIFKWGRRLNVLADASKRFEVELCHVFGEDLMVNSIFFCHFEQTNPWIPLPSCGSPLSLLLQCFKVVSVYPTEW